MKTEGLEGLVTNEDVGTGLEGEASLPDAEAIGRERVVSVENEVNKLGADGLRRMEDIERGSGLSVEEIAFVRDGLGITKRLEGIGRLARGVIDVFKEEVEELFRKKGNPESITTQKYLEAFDGLSLDGNPELKETVRQNILDAEHYNKEQYEAAAADLRISPEVLKERMQQKVDQMMERANFFRATELGSLAGILTEGRFKSQFETAKSGGKLAPRVRAREEAAMFGFNRIGSRIADIFRSSQDYEGKNVPEEALEKDKERRPIYGYFSDDANGIINEEGTIPPPSSVQMYGAISIKVKKANALTKTTITFQDSLTVSQGAPPSPAAKPHFTSFDWGFVDNGRNIDQLERTSKMSWGARYTEAQYHGGLSMEDVESVHISTKNGMTPDDIQRVREMFENYKQQHPESTAQLIEY